MYTGIGIDIVEVARIKDIALRWKDHFLHRVFTQDELAYAAGKVSQYQHLAARFAAKEAVRKAFDAHEITDAVWTDIEIRHEPFGKPTVRLHGLMKELRARMKIKRILISLSHTQLLAVASVVLIRDEDAS